MPYDLIERDSVVCNTKRHMDLIVSIALSDLNLEEDTQKDLKLELENKDSYLYKYIVEQNAKSFIDMSAVPQNNSIHGFSLDAYCQHSFYILNNHQLFGDVLESLNLSLERKDLLTENFVLLQLFLTTFIQECVRDYYERITGIVLEPRVYTELPIICNPKGSLYNVVEGSFSLMDFQRKDENVLLTNRNRLFLEFDQLISKYSGNIAPETEPRYIATSTTKETVMTIFDVCYLNAGIRDFDGITEAVKEEKGILEDLFAVFNYYTSL